MAPSAISVGSLAFVGPAHVPALTEFHYVRVVSVTGSSARISLVDPDGTEDEFAEEIETSVLLRRSVCSEEREQFPGPYVGHAVAFAQNDGPAMVDQWAFGVVTGYRMVGTVVWLHVHHAGESCKIELHRQQNVVMVDWINYVLQTAGTPTWLS
ncbi:hypothetical protein PI124_g19874 [Phytophthora idaei]|nr:hypothetical protein PI125_g15057 [Phytophthora idaei]KAG3126741.1 hypothetical protein PI126_g22196 [Phytophthora idaei]KAG3235086.1 hypothetical protein PI124_g19874 [Phytophthora idaei]